MAKLTEAKRKVPGDWICAQRHYCGRYTFSSWLPKYGLTGDQERWIATNDGHAVPGAYETLEGAMRAALRRWSRE